MTYQAIWSERQRKGERLWRGFQATLPVALSVIPFGVAYGAVAAQTLAPWQAALMSLTVFAGTAQFVAASMLSQGAAYISVLITGLLINMRLILLSAALVPHVRNAPRRLYGPMAHLLTDESFAVSIAAFERGAADAFFYLGSGLAIFAIWQPSTWVGVFFGASLPMGLGLEYALPASLVCLLFLLVRQRLGVAVAGLAAALALLVRQLAGGTWSTLIATIVAATLGVLWKQWRSRS